jgi:ElaB/YqjD/DUF883 family membrane-anchored ribosome-binding protein
MDHETEVIRQQMDLTRADLQEKLETLEQQVKETVQETTEAVTGTVAAVKETVDTVKETVQETVEAVKETVDETVVGVKEALNLNRMVQEHPWPMVAGATVVGFVGGRLLASLPAKVVGPPSALAAALPPLSGTVSPSMPRRNWWSFVTDHYSEELDKLKGLAIAAVGNLVREALAENLPPQFASGARETIDGLVTKLGAKPIEQPLFHLGDRHQEEEDLADAAKAQEAISF